MAITARRICWPQFDRVCLIGGCIYCNDHPYRTLTVIRKMIPDWDEERYQAFYEGKEHDFYNADTK